MRLPHAAALIVALALLVRALPAPAAEQQPWPTCANFRNQSDAQITYQADRSDPLGLAASAPARNVPCGGNVAFGTQPLISCAVLDTRPNARASLQRLYAYTRGEGDPYGLDPDGNGIACDQSDHGENATPQSVDLALEATPLLGSGMVDETTSSANTNPLASSTPTNAPSDSKSGKRSRSNAGMGTPSSLDNGFGASSAFGATPVASSKAGGSKAGGSSLPSSASQSADMGTSGRGTASDTGASGSGGGGTGKSGSNASGIGKTGSGIASTSKQGAGNTHGTGKHGGGNTSDVGATTKHGGNGHQHSTHTPTGHAKGHGKHHKSNGKGNHHHHGGHHANSKKKHRHGGHHKKH